MIKETWLVVLVGAIVALASGCGKSAPPEKSRAKKPAAKVTASKELPAKVTASKELPAKADASKKPAVKSALAKDDPALADEVVGKMAGDMTGLPPVAAAGVGEPDAGEGEDAAFLLPDLGWGDPFLHPQNRIGSQLGAEDVLPDLGDEAKKTWQDAVSALTISCIIGLETDLAAIVAGSRVHPGDTVMGEKLKFEIEMITKDTVHLRCVSKEEEFAEFTDIKLNKKITF